MRSKRAFVSYVGSPIEGACRAAQPPLPAVLERERGDLDGVGSGCARECAEPFALGRCRLELARERGERTTNRVVADVVRVVQLADRLPEGARLTRRPLVAYGLSDEHEPPARTCAGRCKEIAVATRGVRPHQAYHAALLERSARFLVEEGLGAWSAWKRALLEPEHEDGVVAPRART